MNLFDRETRLSWATPQGVFDRFVCLEEERSWARTASVSLAEAWHTSPRADWMLMRASLGDIPTEELLPSLRLLETQCLARLGEQGDPWRGILDRAFLTRQGRNGLKALSIDISALLIRAEALDRGEEARRILVELGGVIPQRTKRSRKAELYASASACTHSALAIVIRRSSETKAGDAQLTLRSQAGDELAVAVARFGEAALFAGGVEEYRRCHGELVAATKSIGRLVPGLAAG